MKDPISNMLVELKNANAVNKQSVVFTYSAFKMAILEALSKAGFIGNVVKKGKKAIKYIEVMLVYTEGKPRINDITRISKTSKRVYMKNNEIRPFKNGYGSYILSTPKGVLTDLLAQKEKVGGEVICSIW